MVKAMPVFRYFDYGRSAECAPSKKGDPSTPCIIVVYPRAKYPADFITNPSKVSRTNRRYQQRRFQFGRPRPGRPRATTAGNYTYLRAMARIWCHLTTRTVIIEWQPILILVVSVSTVRVGYAEMSLNAQRRNKLLHSIWVNKAPCGSPGENGPPRICQYPWATRVSIIYWHFW